MTQERLKAIYGVLFFVLLSIPSLSQAPPSALPQKIKVYLVGTFHFDGATGDVYKTAREDMKTPEHQRELDDLVQRLAKASPDRIFVEWTPDRQGYVETTYQLYLHDQFELGNNEVYQVGYRLGNMRIYTNILRQIDVAHDKAILLYIGSGHISFLKQIFSSSLLFEVEDIVPMLKEP